MTPSPHEHGSASTIEILPVAGLPEFRPGDDLGAAVAAAAPWLRDSDVVVVTSKVVSKCEGRLVAAPEDPEERDELSPGHSITSSARTSSIGDTVSPSVRAVLRFISNSTFVER